MKKLKAGFILPVTAFFILIFSINVSAEKAVRPKSVIPCGIPIGIAVYSKGVLVTGTENISGSTFSEEVKKGDVILKANGADVNSAAELSEIINSCDSPISIVACRSGHIFETTVQPTDTDSGKKIGLWVRDSTAGIGTLTWYNPETKDFAALGHGISDSDTLSLINIRHGDIYACKIMGVKKGEKGVPGEINGAFSGKSIGSIESNNAFGISGRLTESIMSSQKSVMLAEKNEIHEGAAYIMCDVDGGGAEPYKAAILRVNLENTDGKNFILKVCDERLLEKTGGIVQGMSGSPIIQNDKLIGAVTHVFLNNPAKGYGVFADKMIEN